MNRIVMGEPRNTGIISAQTPDHFCIFPAILTEIKPNYYSQVYQGECHVSGLSILFPVLP